jgi:hypothetical protein
MNQTRATFELLFETELKLLQNSACQACDPDIKHPLLPWLVGDQFESTRERVVFVGKPHRGTPGTMLSSGILDPTPDVGGDQGLWKYGWAYWGYTRAIAERLYGEKAFNSIALSNLIKCTNTHDTDATTPTMAQRCLSELGVHMAGVRDSEAVYGNLLHVQPISPFTSAHSHCHSWNRSAGHSAGA